MTAIDWRLLVSTPGRWQRKYKFVFIVLLVILSVQFLLGYQSSKLDDQVEGTSGETGVGAGAFSHLSGGSYPVDDDEGHHSHDANPPAIRSISSNEVGDTRQKPHEETAKEKKSGEHEDSSLTQPGIPCQVQSKDALSAVNRARTEECKRKILETVCAIEADTFYAHQLTSRCPRGNFTTGRSLGCFQDDQSNRLLSGFYANNKINNSPKRCIEICLQSGFTYAGVQYGSECFCGHSPPPSTAQLADSRCTKKCPVEDGEEGEVCGGYFTMNVFETGISKFEAQTAELIPKQGATRVKVVFLLTLNGRALRQVKRLIRALYSSSHYFYIHVDARQDYLFRELLALEKDFPNIRLTHQRFSTIWGGASLLTMLLSCMRELLQRHGDWKWDFVINLSESDFPVKRLDRLVDFLTANRGRNFVKSHGRETQRFVQKQGLDKTFVECDMHMWRVGDRQLPLGIQVDGGSDWVALDRRFVEFVIAGEDSQDELVQGLLRIFRHTLLPAESFFHTMLRNSEFCGSYVDNNLHFTNWKRKLGCKCQYRHVVDWCGCSPNDFKPEDWPRLEGTEAKQLFFARKFEPIISQAAVQRLEEWMFGARHQQVENYGSYWQSVYHHEDKSPAADDALLTLSASLARQAVRAHFGEEEEEEVALQSLHVLEVTYCMQEDRFKGFLVRFRIRLGAAAEDWREFEVLTKGTQQVQTNKKSKFAQRLSVLEVSTDFDQKEQRARNYAKAMGPYAEPFVVFQLQRRKGGEGEQMANVTALWIDPVGNVADVSEVPLDDQPNGIYFSKSNALHPMTVGVWAVKLLQRGTAVAQVKFLVLPLEVFNGKAISAERARIVNGGTENEVNYQNAVEWDRHLLPREERVQLMEKVRANGQRYGAELEAWVDRLVKSFYLVHELCEVQGAGVGAAGGKERDVNRAERRRFDDCEGTSWSSRAPDPKSEIRAQWGGEDGEDGWRRDRNEVDL